MRAALDDHASEEKIYDAQIGNKKNIWHAIWIGCPAQPVLALRLSFLLLLYNVRLVGVYNVVVAAAAAAVAVAVVAAAAAAAAAAATVAVSVAVAGLHRPHLPFFTSHILCVHNTFSF